MPTIEETLRKGGIRLDIGCGANKQSPAWVGLDIRELPGVDIVHDINVHPWPLPDESVIIAVCSHLVEHIPPVAISADGSTRFPFIEFMDEVWRIMQPDGDFAIAVPHGSSQGFRQDPTHIAAFDEATWSYFDPLCPRTGGLLYRIYKPKPWKIKSLNWDPTTNIEVVLTKRREDKSYYG